LILLAEQNTIVALRYTHFGYILESGRKRLLSARSVPFTCVGAAKDRVALRRGLLR